MHDMIYLILAVNSKALTNYCWADVPPEPAGLHLKDYGSTSAVLGWQHPSDSGLAVDCYELEVERSDVSSGSPKRAAAAGAAGLSNRTYIRKQSHALVKGLRCGAPFRARARAHNVCGWGPYCAWATFTTASKYDPVCFCYEYRCYTCSTMFGWLFCQLSIQTA